MKTVGLIGACLVLAGCASLEWRPGDSTGTKITKGTARVLIGLPTLGVSEIMIERDAWRRNKVLADEARALYFADLQAKLSRYRTMAEHAATPEDRETALRLADGVLSEIQSLASARGTTCTSTGDGKNAVIHCR